MNKKGFTLTEMIVVISIMVIMLGLALPRLMRSSAGIRLRTAAESYGSLASAAKSMADVQNCRVRVSFNTGKQRMYLEREDFDDADGDGDKDEFMSVDQGYEVGTKISVNVTGGNSGNIIFTPWGGIEGTDAEITFASQQLGKDRKVTITAQTGYIEVE